MAYVFTMMGGSYKTSEGGVRIVSRGDKIEDIDEKDLKRLQDMGALKDEEEYEGEAPTPVVAVRPGDMPVDQLAEHIKSNKLTVPATIELAQDDAAIAERVLEAEEMATGGDPRKGVVDALNAVIDEADGE